MRFAHYFVSSLPQDGVALVSSALIAAGLSHTFYRWMDLIASRMLRPSLLSLHSMYVFYVAARLQPGLLPQQ